jgi:hypothetical protein
MEFEHPVLASLAENAAPNIFATRIGEGTDPNQAVERIEEPITHRAIMDGMAVMMAVDKGFTDLGGDSLHGETS